MHQSMTPIEQFFDIVKHFVLPTVTLTLVSVGSMMRYTRTNMLEVLIRILFVQREPKAFLKNVSSITTLSEIR